MSLLLPRPRDRRPTRLSSPRCPSPDFRSEELPWKPSHRRRRRRRERARLRGRLRGRVVQFTPPSIRDAHPVVTFAGRRSDSCSHVLLILAGRAGPSAALGALLAHPCRTLAIQALARIRAPSAHSPQMFAHSPTRTDCSRERRRASPHVCAVAHGVNQPPLVWERALLVVVAVGFGIDVSRKAMRAVRHIARAHLSSTITSGLQGQRSRSAAWSRLSEGSAAVGLLSSICAL
jgi:hypothetical protein